MSTKPCGLAFTPHTLFRPQINPVSPVHHRGCLAQAVAACWGQGQHVQGSHLGHLPGSHEQNRQPTGSSPNCISPLAPGHTASQHGAGCNHCTDSKTPIFRFFCFEPHSHSTATLIQLKQHIFNIHLRENVYTASTGGLQTDFKTRS